MTSEDWKAYRKQIQARRHENQLRIEVQIVEQIVSGSFDARLLDDYHWRIWHRDRPKRTVDFWPRTGTYQVENRIERPGPDKGWREVQKILNEFT